MHTFENLKHCANADANANKTPMPTTFVLCRGLTTRQPLWIILCRLPEEWRKEIEEIVEVMKERDREERGTGMKVKKQKK